MIYDVIVMNIVFNSQLFSCLDGHKIKMVRRRVRNSSLLTVDELTYTSWTQTVIERGKNSMQFHYFFMGLVNYPAKLLLPSLK